MQLFAKHFLAVLAAAQGVTAQAQSSGTPHRPTEPRDRITCRRFVRTGSLINGYRSCKSNREWAREHDNIRLPAATSSCRSQGEGGSCE